MTLSALPTSRAHLNHFCRLSALLLLLCLLATCLPSAVVRAEGSSDLIERGGFRPFLEFRNDAAGGVLRRTVIKVFARPGETINLGSSANGVGGGRIDYRDPRGVAGTCALTQGVITTLAQEQAGPLPTAGGYTPCVVQVGPGQEGIWEVDFVSPNPASRADPPPTPVTTQWTQPATVGYVASWDVLVRSAQGDPLPGRAFANYLALNMGSNGVSLNSEVYIQTRDGYRYRINLNGIDPFGFIFFANNKGFKDAQTNAGLYRSVQFFGGNPGRLPGTVTVQNPGAPDSETDVTHKIFFETPDPNLPPDALAVGGTTWLLRPPTLPPAPTDFSFTGKEGTPDQAGFLLGGLFSFTSAAAGTYEITIDLNRNDVYGDANDAVLIGDAVIGTNEVVWDGRDALGNPVPASDTNYKAAITLNAGEVHFPFVDPENNPRGLIIERLLPASTSLERFTVHYDDSYRFTGANTYDHSLCSAGDSPPPPAFAAIAPDTASPCYGTPPVPVNGRAGVNSNPDFNPATGADGLRGAREFTNNGGDRRGMDTWVYVPSPEVLLGGTLIAVKQADLAIEKTHADPVVAGGPIIYTITARNNGPSPVQNAPVTDSLPPEITNPSWTCQPGPGASCAQASGTGPISTTVSLPSGGQVVFTLNGTLAPATIGDVVNAATIERPPDVTDPNLSNNTATDRVSVGPRLLPSKSARLVVDADGNGLPSAGDTLEYMIAVTNTGSGPATNVTLRDQTPANTSYLPGSSSVNGAPIADGPGGAQPFATGVAVSSPGAPPGTIAVGASVSAAFRVQIVSPLPPGVTEIANTVVVGAPDTPPTSPFTHTIGVTPDPAIAASKTAGLAVDADGNGLASPGDTIAYTITVVNNGQGSATGVLYSDSPDPNGSLVAGSVTTSQGTISGGNAGTPPVTVALGTLAPGASATISYRVTVDNPLEPGVVELVNQGVASGTNFPPTKTDDPRTPEPGDPTRVPLVASPALQQVKRDTLLVDADGDGLPSPGDTLLYTLDIVNSGNTAALDVLLTDQPDPNTTLVAGSVQTSQGTVTRGNAPGDRDVRVELGAIPAGGGSATVSFQVTINTPFPAGVSEVANQGIVQGSNTPPGRTDDPKTPTPDDPTRTPVVVRPAIDSTKSASLVGDANGNGRVDPGDTLLYIVDIVNTGNGAATGVIYRDTVDPNTTIVAGSVQTSQGLIASGNAGGRSILVNLGTIPPGGTATVGYRVTVNTPFPTGVTQVRNQGTTSGNFPPNLTDDPKTPTPDDPTVVPISLDPLLQATKRDALLIDADGNGGASAGDTLLYIVEIVNIGNGPATVVTYSDVPDPNTTLVAGSVTTSQGTITGGNAGTPPVTVDLGAIGPGSRVTISYAVRVNSPLPPGVSELINQGTVRGANVPSTRTDDPDTPEPGDPTRTPLLAQPLLSALKSASLVVDANANGIVEPGDTLEYLIRIENRGNAPANGLTFSDSPDPNTTLVAGSVTTSQGTITGGNTGTPPVTVDLGALGAGASATISFRVTVNTPLPAGLAEVANQGLVRGSDTPAQPTDDPRTPAPDDPTRTPVRAQPLVETFKRDTLLNDLNGDGLANPGETLLYTIDVINSGNTAATGLFFRDSPDPSTRLVAGSVQTSRGLVRSGNAAGEPSVVVEIGTLGAGEQARISFAVLIVGAAQPGVTAISNQGITSGSNVPPHPSDDPDTPAPDDPTLTPLAPAQPLLSAAKRATLVGDANGDGLANPGDTLEYTVEIFNNGSGPAAGVVFSDTIDPNTTLVAGSLRTSQGSITASGGQINADIGTIAPGQRVTLSFQATINSPLPADVTAVSNRGLVQSIGILPVPTDNPRSDPNDPTVVPLGPQPLLSASKRDILFADVDGDGTASPGDIIQYIITLQNLGAGTASAVTFSDTPDPNTTLVVGSVTTSQGTITGGNAGTPPVTVSLGALPPGQMATISFQVRVNSPLPASVTEIANQGLFGSSNGGTLPTDDPDTPEPDDPTRTDISQAAGLRISKTDFGAEVQPGEVVRYTLSFTNTGVVPLFDVIVRETVPQYTSFDAAGSTPGWSCADGAPAGTACEINVGALPGTDGTGRGGTGSVVFALRLDQNIPENVERIVNIATIGTASRPASGNDPQASDTTPIVRPTFVVLTSFTTRYDYAARGIAVSWETALELDSWGFHLWRSANGRRENATRVTPTIIPARGGPYSGASYSFLDRTARPGLSYSYWLEEIEIGGGRYEYGPTRFVWGYQRPGEIDP